MSVLSDDAAVELGPADPAVADTITDLVEIASLVTACPVIVTDGQGRVLAHSAAPCAPAHWAQAILMRSATDGLTPLLETADFARLRTTTGPVPTRRAHVAAPLRACDRIVGIVVAQQAADRFAEAVEVVGERLATCLAARNDSGRQRSRLNAFQTLLQGEPAQLLSGHVHRLLLFATTAPATCDVALHIRRALSAAVCDLQVLTAVHNEVVYALCVQRSPRPVGQIERAGQAVCRSLDQVERVLVGPAMDRDADVPRARQALEDLVALSSDPVVCSDDVPELVILGGIRRWLRSSATALLPALRTLCEHDTLHDTSYVATLRAYLDADRDSRSAAAAIGVHPNTVRYRVHRALELAGLDLGDPLRRLAVEVQLRLLLPAGASDHIDIY